ncbi:MAG: LacI family DNA-binding transcriptional regulator [Eubacteriales bacterium]|nr:LacI family DNA-binding transcriptional regulator [Eubacteriales bacterium]
MITIKEIAKIAGLSPSTVSIVLSGKAKERKISQRSTDKILKIASENGYVANIQAIGLRTSASSPQYRIVIFWTADYRAKIMIRFIQTIESEILARHIDCEVLLKPYEPSHLKEAMTDDLIRSCHGILICNASEDDLAFLEKSSFPRPIVLYNRYSKIYPTVTMDDAAIGRLPADIFAIHGCRNPAIVASPATFNGMTMRSNIFAYECVEKGLAEPVYISCEATLEGGYDATSSLLTKYPETDCIFYSSDTLSLGAIRYFLENKIQVPQDLKIIAVGNNDLSFSAMCYPSVSVIYLPIEDMAKECLSLLMAELTYRNKSSTHANVPIQYIPRESCPEIIPL